MPKLSCSKTAVALTFEPDEIPELGVGSKVKFVLDASTRTIRVVPVKAQVKGSKSDPIATVSLYAVDQVRLVARWNTSGPKALGLFGPTEVHTTTTPWLFAIPDVLHTAKSWSTKPSKPEAPAQAAAPGAEEVAPSEGSTVELDRIEDDPLGLARELLSVTDLGNELAVRATVAFASEILNTIKTKLGPEFSMAIRQDGKLIATRTVAQVWPG